METKVMTSNINSWAMKVARCIVEIPEGHHQTERIANVIAMFADPIVALLCDSKRGYDMLCHAVEFMLVVDGKVVIEACTCGADAWNARVDAALAGKGP